ncbi:hypothetical protein M9R32_13940 [Paenisporosarcina quisquiliarum]|uniref:Uncharacterized protein n=1 Tax=Paenisporosarcina quisquiliarum TaxID=365346 RepID=A0A9X3RFB2_9BACL|nr:hypothetical protein [Paenisporosarcina quisquiliarum]MCZ8538293.1 hypothetical protein [Paenisporosarcina quisquiliarum]
MSMEREKIESLLAELPDSSALILKEILQAEKEVLHLKNLQGTTIINDIVNIVKERINE